MRRIFILLLGVIFLTGCGSKGAVEGQEEESGYKSVTLFCDVEFWGAPLWDISEDSISGEISKKTGAVIEVIDKMEDADKQLSIMLANDNLPDVISVTDGTVMNQLITSGKVWNLEEFLKKYKPDSHLLKDFPEDIRYELEKRDGGWFAYPSHMSSPDNRKKWKPDEYYRQETEFSWNLVIMWNKELLQELDLNVQELGKETQVLKALEKARKAGISEGKEIVPLLVDGEFFQQHTLHFLARSFGAEDIDENGNYIDYFLQPEMKTALAFLNTAMRNGYMTPDQLVYKNSRVKQLLNDEKVLCFIGNMSNTGASPSLWESSGAVFSETGEIPIYMQNLRRTTGWINTFISKDCESPKTVAKLLDYMTSDAGQRRWVYGTEGIHYTMDENRKIEVTEDGTQAQADYIQSGVNVWWMFFNLDWSRSVVKAPDRFSENAMNNNIACAYARSSGVRSCDGTALQYLNEGYKLDEEYEQLEAEIEKWKEEQIKLVILAETEEKFESEYKNLVQGLIDRRVERLDDKKNEEYQKNCEEYNVHIEKVNKHEEITADNFEESAR